jgi:hypothetical protein
MKGRPTKKIKKVYSGLRVNKVGGLVVEKYFCKPFKKLKAFG